MSHGARSGSSRRKRLEARCAQAGEHARHGRLGEASALFRQVLDADPAHAGALHGLALVLRRQGDRVGAIGLLESLLAQPGADAAAAHNLGNLYREAGRTHDAVRAWQRALELSPQHEHARFALAGALLDVGDAPGAAAHLERLRSAHPADPAVLNSLGLARIAAGDHDAAVECFDAATRAAPEDASSWQNLAEALIVADRLEEALAAARRAHGLAPSRPEVRRTLGHASMHMECYPEAIEHLGAVVERAADDHLARLWLARALTEEGRLDEALAHCDEGVRRAPGRADFHSFRGNALRHLGRYEDARAAYEAALDADPRWVDALNNLAMLCADLGERDRARGLLERALAVEPEAAEVWLNVVRSGALGKLDDERLARLEASLARPGIAHESRVAMHFAIAQACDARRRYDDAFEHYRLGNALKRRTVRFEAQRFQDWAAGIRDTFTPALLERLAGCGDPSARPVFVVGMPRSGTTLVEQILASHPDVHGADELTRVTELADGLRGPAGEPYPRAAAALTCEQAARLGRDYAAYLASLDDRALRVTDKMPGNHFHLGLIAVMLPNARIIHCRRDPMDACLSNYIQLFGGGHYYSYDLDDIAVYYNAYAALMRHWHALLPGRVLDVDYEALVEHQERESRRLVEWIGLPWDDRCLAFHETRRTVRTASHHQVRQPIYRTSRERWKRYERHLAGLRAAISAGGRAAGDADAAPCGARA